MQDILTERIFLEDSPHPNSVHVKIACIYSALICPTWKYTWWISPHLASFSSTPLKKNPIFPLPICASATPEELNRALETLLLPGLRVKLGQVDQEVQECLPTPTHWTPGTTLNVPLTEASKTCQQLFLAISLLGWFFVGFFFFPVSN